MSTSELSLLDSRRITGAHLVLSGPGALIDITGPEAQTIPVIARWREFAVGILDAIGWAESGVASRLVPGGASLGFTAPIDALYAATEVNEWAWRAAVASLEGSEHESLAAATQRLRSLIAEEVSPPLIALALEARRRGVPFVSDDDLVSVGLGRGSRTWPVAELPDPRSLGTEVPWDDIGEIPVIAVTGTNGKTTTIRLLASIAHAAGLVAGFTSTDGVYIGGELVDAGDYSGPGGARMVVRDRRVEIALLETARGGLLRRGLPLERATAVAVTNVGADHLGEFGVHDVDAIAETKLTVVRLVDDDRPGAIVLNADDSRLLAHGLPWGSRVTWFTLAGDHPEVRAHREAKGRAATLEGKVLTLWTDGAPTPIAHDDELPVTYGGFARHNVANALAAAALAHAAGIGIEAIAAGLRSFEATPENSPGRGNWFDIDGVKIYVDFAHNPHGFEAMASMVARLSHERLGIVLGQAGDRDDASIRELTAITCGLHPARIVIKDMPQYYRGREPGEIPAIIEDELRRLGYPDDRVSHAPTEGEAVEALRRWARRGDLLVLPLHAERDAVIATLRS